MQTQANMLSLVPPDKESYALWVLGLNTALTAVELHKGDGIHPLRPARKLPLSQYLTILDSHGISAKESTVDAVLCLTART